MHLSHWQCSRECEYNVEFMGQIPQNFIDQLRNFEHELIDIYDMYLHMLARIDKHCKSN